MKEVSWVLHFVPMKNIMMERLMVHLIGSHCDEMIELHWDLEIELRMDLNLRLMKETSWVPW